MRVAIIGHGQVGTALAAALSRAGHATVFGVRNPPPGAVGQSGIAEAVAGADAAILGVPFGAAAEVIEAAGGFPGIVLIDATNPLGMSEAGLHLMVGHATSGAEQIAALAPRARVVKAFNQTGFENLGNARAYPVPPVMFVAGDDPQARAVACTLVADAGFDAVDIGPLRAARLLEPLAMLWIELARKGGAGPHFAFTLQRKA